MRGNKYESVRFSSNTSSTDTLYAYKSQKSVIVVSLCVISESPKPEAKSSMLRQRQHLNEPFQAPFSK